jgi:hypothetical protein
VCVSDDWLALPPQPNTATRNSSVFFIFFARCPSPSSSNLMSDWRARREFNLWARRKVNTQKLRTASVIGEGIGRHLAELINSLDARVHFSSFPHALTEENVASFIASNSRHKNVSLARPIMICFGNFFLVFLLRCVTSEKNKTKQKKRLVKSK